MSDKKTLFKKLSDIISVAFSVEEQKTLTTPLMDEPTPVKTIEVKTKEGISVFVSVTAEGEIEPNSKVFIDVENTLPAPNGTHTLEDGTTITVVDGIVTEVKKTENIDAPVNGVAEMKAQMTEQKNAYELKFAEVEKSNKVLSDKIDLLYNKINQILEAPINTTLSKDSNEDEIPYEQMTNVQKAKFNKQNKY